jgi:hypothetical protein
MTLGEIALAVLSFSVSGLVVVATLGILLELLRRRPR